MSEMVLTGNEAFFSESKVKVNKRKVIATLKEKLEHEKCELLKTTLTSMNILYDDSITDVNVLLKNLKSSLTEREYSLVYNEYEKIVKDLDDVCERLKAGSTSAFTDFVNKYIKGIGASVVDSSAVSMAFRTAVLVAPTVELKIAAGAASLLYSGYRLVKNDKNKKIVDKAFEVDRILAELETTKNTEGVILDTRFNEKNQQLIREFLKEKDIEFLDTGYLSLRQAMSNLSVDEKEQLATILVNSNGLNIPVGERLEKYDKSFLSDLKSHVIKPIAVSTTAGATIASGINAFDNTLLSGPLNGTIIGTWILSKLSTGKAGSWLSKFFGITFGGPGGIIIEEVIKEIPIIGSPASKLFSLENLAFCSGVGLGIGVIGSAVRGVVNAIKKGKERFAYRKERAALEKVDSEIYAKQDLEEITKMREYLLNHPTPEETSIIEIVKEYMDELGIEYRKNPTSILALKQDLQELESKDKDKVYHFLESLEETNHKDPNKFKAFLKKAGTIVRNTIVYGLAGMSVYDIITGGKFLSDLSLKISGKYDELAGVKKDLAAARIERDELTKQMDAQGYIEQVSDAGTTAIKIEKLNTDQLSEMRNLLRPYNYDEFTDKFVNPIEYNGVSYATREDLFNAMRVDDLYALLSEYPDPTIYLEKLQADKLKVFRDFAEKAKSADFVYDADQTLNQYLDTSYNPQIDGMKEMMDHREKIDSMIRDYEATLENYDKVEKLGHDISNVVTPVVAIEELESEKNKNR